MPDAKLEAMPNKKYSEELIRHQAVDAEGHPCEILERITFETVQRKNGEWSEPAVFNRRFDLKTGQMVSHVGGSEYEVIHTGERLRMS